VGGWVESGRVVERLAAELASPDGPGPRGTLVSASLVALLERGGRVVGARGSDGVDREADVTVCALGAWTPYALRWLAGSLRATGHPVFLLRPRPEARALFSWERFATYGADIARTGWYGFPLHPREGLVKIAHHGAGRVVHPEDPARAVSAHEIDALWAFVRDALPALADAELVRTRLCLYSDTDDGHFWIDRDPERDGLVVASGDSGHALKFSPLVGPWIADACEGRAPAMDGRFRWRAGERAARNGESARAWVDL
jgi:glycine/D-amino acid oxidase-like deaminating enzyme